MSPGVRTSAAAATTGGWRSGKIQGLPWSANLYLIGVAAVTAAAIILFFAERDAWRGGWLTFAILASCAATAQLFMVRTGRDQGFHTAAAFLVAAALLLPPGLVALVVLVQHVPEWIKERYRWYIQSFNICNFTLSALGAYGVAHLVLSTEAAGADLRWALAAFAAMLSFVALNHLLLATMLRLARGHTFRESGLFWASSLCKDVVVGCLGVALAFVWQTNPALVPVVVAPLVLSHNSFSVLALLRRSEERFRAMFESSAMGIGLADLDGRFLSSNRALEKMLGYTGEELLSRSLAAMSHEEDVSLSAELSRELVAGKRDHYRLEQRYLRADGAVWWGSLTVSLIRDADGKPELTIAMMTDITTRKRAEEARAQVEAERERVLAQEREQNRLKDEFVATVSHELRTPLTSIIGYLEIMLDGEAGELEPEQKAYLEVIERNAGGLLELVRDLLFVGQVNAGRVDLDLEPVSLSQLAAECVESARPAAEEKGVQFTFHGDEMPMLPGDRRRLVQVADNLISNALKFTDRGGTVAVRSILEGDDRAVFEVEDSGIGIPDVDQPRLFTRFYRASAASERAVPGTGLGLSIAKMIVDAHGGQISFESREGTGSTFRVELSLVEPGELAITSEPAEPAMAAEAA
jgi:PAS domain S-box-containing protein